MHQNGNDEQEHYQDENGVFYLPQRRRGGSESFSGNCYKALAFPDDSLVKKYDCRGNEDQHEGENVAR